MRVSSQKKRTRKSRAGQDTHPSGNYVRKPAAHIVRPKEEPEADEADAEPAASRPAGAITLPQLKFLQRKKIAGELI